MTELIEDTIRLGECHDASPAVSAAVNVLRLILGEGLRVTFAGIAIGVVGALALSRLLVNLLYGVSAADPFTFAAVAALLIVVAIAACYLLARRATRVDPIVALRYE